MKLFKRKLQIIIGKLGTVSKKIEGLRVSFDIEMTDTKETNKANIKLYNLSDDTIGFLEQKDSSVILQIAYDDDEYNTLYIGNIVEFDHEQNGSDFITTIECKDGFIPLSEKKLSLSFPANSTTAQILNRITSELNLTKGDYKNITNFVYKQGFSFVGNPGSALDILLNRIGYEWIINNNQLIISEKNKSDKKTVVRYLSPNTGLLNSPSRIKNAPVKKSQKKDKLTDGWKIQSLILPDLQPKTLIKVQSEDFNNIFLIKKSKFSGDTRGSDWICEMECVQQ